MASTLPSRQIARVVAELAQRVRRLERRRQPAGDGLISDGAISSGHARLDRLLGAGGFRRGTLVEWLAGPGVDPAAGGAGTLALVAARQAARAGGAIVVVDRAGLFYPPAAVRLGIDLEQLIVVRPDSDPDQAWALDQVLRTRGVAAAWCRVDAQDDHTLRRWQLAAETSGVLGLLVRPEGARHEPSWAELRLLVEPMAQPDRADRNRRLRVTLLRSRAADAGCAVEIEIPTTHGQQQSGERQEALEPRTRGSNHETRSVHLASSVAVAKTGRRARGA